MSMRTRQRNNTIAGFFVLAGVAGFLTVAIVLSDLPGIGGERAFNVAFPLDLGVPGLAVGSDVTVGMIPTGRVTEIRAVPADDPEAKDLGPHIRVVVTLPKSYTIRRDADVGLVVPLLGSGTYVNFADLGRGELLADGEVIRGGIAPPIFLASAGIGPEQIEQLKTTLKHAEQISADFEEISTFARERLTTDGAAMMDRARDVVDRIAEIVDSISERYQEWLASFDRIRGNIEDTTAQGPEFMRQARGVADDVRSGVARVREIVDRVAPDVERTSDNVAAITTEFREVTLAKVNDLLDRGRSGLDDATRILGMLDESLAADLPQIARTLGNMRLASDNLKLAMIEIRAEPWRVLYTPKDKELRESLLHDAVRTYASAVSDLESASRSLQALHDRYGADLNPDSPTVALVLAQLEESFAKYKKAEDRWFELILNRPVGQKLLPDKGGTSGSP